MNIWYLLMSVCVVHPDADPLVIPLPKRERLRKKASEIPFNLLYTLMVEDKAKLPGLF